MIINTFKIIYKENYQILNVYLKENLKPINLKIINLIKIIQESVNDSIEKEYNV